MPSYQSYKARKLAAFVVVFAYLGVALLTEKPAIGEVFPFFNWSLFPIAPGERTARASLLIRVVDGVPIDPPRRFDEMGDTFKAARLRDARVSKLSMSLLNAIRTRNQPAIRQLKSTLENSYMLEAESVEYELVIVYYDPIERYRTGAIEAVRTIASLKKVSPQ